MLLLKAPAAGTPEEWQGAEKRERRNNTVVTRVFTQTHAAAAAKAGTLSAALSWA